MDRGHVRFSAVLKLLCVAALVFFAWCFTQNLPAADDVKSAAVGNSGSSPSHTTRPADWAEFHDTVQPFLIAHCISCHGDDMPEGEVSLNHFDDAASLERGTPALDKMLNMLRSRKMPPKDEPRPSEDEYHQVIAWLNAYTTQVELAAPSNPGHVTLRRLNRAEYNNTIHDLLGIDLNPADAFPVDEAGYGFDNNGDVLSMAPVLMEKYLNAATISLDKDILVEPALPPPLKRWTDVATLDGTVPKSDPNAHSNDGGPFNRSMPNGRVFPYGGEIYGDYVFPKSGTYIFRLRGYGTQGAATKQRPSVVFKIDGQTADRPFNVQDDQRNTSVYSTKAVSVAAGAHRITLAFLNGATRDEYAAAMAPKPPTTGPAAGAAIAANTQTPDPPAARPAPATAPSANPAVAGGQRGGARGAGGANGRGGGPPPPVLSPTGKPTLGVVYFEVEGPQEVSLDRMPDSYRKIFVALPSATVPKAQAARQIITNFATRAYRRPVLPSEVDRLMAYWSQIDKSGETFDRSIDAALQPVLVSPNFLYRVEADPGPDDPGGVRTLNEYELASRLSYFLWSSMPDDELFKLADQGKLRANLPAQVKRMLADPKSFALVENFAGQWLQLRQMANVVPDPARFPDFNESLRADMLKETQLFFSAIVTEDRSVLDFIDADFTFLNERLAKHYGMTGVTGDQFRRVALAGGQRGGLITQASILTITSYSNRTSPVQRGKWVLENLLDEAPPPPPPDVPKLAETAQAELTGTLRQRMEQHRTNPNCVSCHAQMDPIGFGLENFDAVGAWRVNDINNVIIDASGTLPDGTTFVGAPGLKKILLAQKDQFCRCLADRMMTFALGRGMESYDKPMIDRIGAGLKDNDYKFSALVMQVVESDAFQKRGSK
jgi:hypothetical protein